MPCLLRVERQPSLITFPAIICLITNLSLCHLSSFATPGRSVACISFGVRICHFSKITVTTTPLPLPRRWPVASLDDRGQLPLRAGTRTEASCQHTNRCKASGFCNLQQTRQAYARLRDTEGFPMQPSCPKEFAVMRVLFAENLGENSGALNAEPILTDDTCLHRDPRINVSTSFEKVSTSYDTYEYYCSLLQVRVQRKVCL